MNRMASKANMGADADGILRELTILQHLMPHRRVAEVVGRVVERMGMCSLAAERAMWRLELDGTRSIGRLQRGELIQLARAMYRLWASALSVPAERKPVGITSPSRPL